MAVNDKKSCDPTALGIRLRAARKEAGFTLVTLGASIGVHYSQLSRIERGVFKGAATNVQKVCKKLKIDWREPRTAFDPIRFATRAAQVASTSPRWASIMLAFLEAVEAAAYDERAASQTVPRRGRTKYLPSEF